MPIGLNAPANAASVAAKRAILTKCVFSICSPPSFLEPDVLQGLGRTAVEPGSTTIVSALGGQVSLGHPAGGAMARGGKLVEGGQRGVEGLARLVETGLLEERAAENELGAADLVEVVVPVGQQLQRLPGLLLCLLELPASKVDLRQRRDCAGRLGVVADL